LDPQVGVALGFRRLAIVDLSHHGHQPMESPSGRHIMVFNGEIYNHGEIRRALEDQVPDLARRIRGQSDTEVALAAMDYWGFEQAITRFAGMFSMAVIDRVDRVLYLCRDRMGEKPLYYGWMNDSFVFGSELKSIRQHPDFIRDLDPEAIELFLQRHFIPAPYSIYSHVRKLLPGTYLALPLSDAQERVESTAYWSVADAARRGLDDRFEGSAEEGIDELGRLLSATVRREMEADVPLGAFLSGGVDSSLVVALMQAANTNPVKTFSIGFENLGFNEAPHAEAVARHLGTEHTELYVTDRDAREVVPLLPSIYDEPFADDSQIPTYLVARLARAHVTVALTGDGGDELFGGYNGYARTVKAWTALSRIPYRFRQSAGSLIDMLPERAIRPVAPRVLTLMGKTVPVNEESVVPRVREIGRSLRASSDPLSLFISIAARQPSLLTSDWKRPGVRKQMHYPDARDARLSPLEIFTLFDQTGELSDGILTKVDRAAMRASLETRAPLLDHSIVEWSWKLRPEWKLDQGSGKWILRELLHRYVPQQLVDRPKQGFSIPIAGWLRGPLRSWAESLVDDRRVSAMGLLDSRAIRREWNQVLSSTDDFAPTMWSVLMLQAWLEHEGYLGT
jgi:asparagine synthase (glutamine-hydrolysing)